MNTIFFNRDGNGAEEIQSLVGLLGQGVEFSVWEPLLPFGVKDIAAIVGREVLDSLSKFYMAGEEPSGEFPEATVTVLSHCRKAIVFFTWLKIIPTLDAQHDTTGRSRRLGENERGLTALQEWKDENNIRTLAYEAVEAMIEDMDLMKVPFWTASPKYKLRSGLLIRSKDDFDSYFNIGSHRLFVTLLPILREVQGAEIAPILGRWLSVLLEQPEDTRPEILPLRDSACRCLVLLTMKKAVERLPVELIPEGVVQIQQTTPVNQRLRAEREARQSVAASLGADASGYLERLASLVSALEGQSEDEVSSCIGPISHSKGFSF